MIEMQKVASSVNIARYEEYMQPIEDFFRGLPLDYKLPSDCTRTNTVHFVVKDQSIIPIAQAGLYQTMIDPITAFSDGMSTLVLGFKDLVRVLKFDKRLQL